MAYRFARVSLFALLIAFQAAQPAMADTVAIRAGERGSGARLVFEWPSAVGFTSAQSGNKITLRFDRPIESDVSNLSARLGDWVKAARKVDGGRGVEITLAQPAQPRSFANGARIVLDLMPRQQASASPTPPPAAPPARQRETARAIPAATVRIGHHATFDRAVLDLGGVSRVARGDQSLTVTTPTPRRLTDAQLDRLKLPQVAKVEQSVRNGQLTLRFTLKPGVTVRNFTSPSGIGLDFAKISAPAAPAARPDPTPAPAAPPPAAPIAELEGSRHAVAPEQEAASETPPTESHSVAEAIAHDVNDHAVIEEVAPVAAPPPTPEAPASAAHQDEAAPPPVAAPNTGAATPIDAMALPADALPAISMLVPKDTPLVVFRRNDSIFVAVPERDTPADLTSLVGAILAADPRAKLVPAQGGRVVRLEVDDRRVNPIIAAIQSGWSIRFSANEKAEVTDLPIDFQPDYALGPRVLLRTDKAGNPVTFVDPVVGDTLIVVPVSPARHGVIKGQVLAQGELMPSLQGVAVRPLSDSLSVLSSSSGIEISASNGLMLAEKLGNEQAQAVEEPLTDPASEDQPAEDAQAAAAEAPVPVLPPLLDFASLGRPAGDQFISVRQELQKAISDAPPEEKDLRRIDLARFYFINGMASEASAIWSMVSAKSPEYADRPEVALYRAIASFSAGTTDEIKARVAALTQPTTDSALWRAMLAVRERDWKTASDYFRQSLGRIGDYPDPYRTRLELALIETSLQTENYPLAERALSRLSDRQRSEMHRLSPAAEYLAGALDWQEDRPDEARARFSSASAGRNQLWHVRSELALIEADLKDHKIDGEEAVKRLERLRFAWRGDALEYDIVYRLAGLRLQNGDFAAAFEDYSKLASKFPNDSRTPGLPEEQRIAFTRIFEGENRDKTPAYSQLAIWDRYPEFRPTDERKQDDIKLYLADRAAGIDLLDRSAAMLTDVLSHVEDPVARAKMGTQLAGLYLLDGKPLEAVKALDDTAAVVTPDQTSPLPESLRDERRILEARAIFGQNKPDEALALLANDYTDPATRLRADITWQTKRWAESAAALEALIGLPPPDGQPLAAGLSPLLVNRATALVLAGDTEGLTDLRVKFGAAMATAPEAATFQLLTRADNAGGLENKLSVLRRVSEVDLFKHFLERYRGGDAAAGATPPASAAATPSAPVAHDAAAH